MKKLFSFFRGIWGLLKKDLRLYGTRIVSMLLLLCLLTLGCALALGASLAGSKEEDKRLSMALYDKEPSSVANMAIEIVSNTEAVQSMFTVEICDTEEEVRDGMKSGVYDAAIIFEEGYFSKILSGEDSAVRILLSDKLTATNDVVNHFAITGEKLIRIAESGVEAAYAHLAKEMSSADAHAITDNMQINYALEIFALPTEGFAVEELPYSANGVDIVGHYILCFTVFLLLLCEVLFFPYAAADCSFSMLRRIKSYRVSNIAIVLEKAILPFLIRFCLLIAIACFLNGVTDVDLSAEAVGSAILCTLLCSIFMSALSTLLSQTSLGISIIFAISVAGLVACGGLIPVSMLPYEMIMLGGFTPSGLCAQLLSPLFYGEASLTAVLIFAFATVALTLAAGLYISRICKRGGGER